MNNTRETPVCLQYRLSRGAHLFWRFVESVRKQIPGFHVTALMVLALQFVGVKAAAFESERIGYLLWERGYGGDAVEEIVSAARHPDGGFVFAGTSTSPISGDKQSANFDHATSGHHRGDYWWLHVDETGEPIKDRSFGGAQRETLSHMLVAENGDFILIGSSFSPPGGSKTQPRFGSTVYSDAWIIRITKDGEELWQRSLGGIGLDSLSKGVELEDGRLLFVGTTSSVAGSGNRTASLRGRQDGWLVCLSAGGDLLWDKTYGDEGVDILQDMCVDATTPGRILLVGRSRSHALVTGDSSTTYHKENYWIVAVDESGEMEWQRFYGGEHGDYATSVFSTPEGIWVGGYSDSGIGGSKTTTYYGDSGWTAAYGVNYFQKGSRHHAWVIVLDEFGNKTDEFIYGGIRVDRLNATLPYGDGWLMGIRSNSFPVDDPSRGNKTSPHFSGEGLPNNLPNYWLVAADSDGDIAWQLTAGGFGVDELKGLFPSAEGVLAVGSSGSGAGEGNRESERKGTTDSWIALIGERTAPKGTVQVWINGYMRDGIDASVAGSAELELRSSNPALELRYTLDGSEPTLNSPGYIIPVVFYMDSTVKARAFDATGTAVGPAVTVPTVVKSTYALTIDSTEGGQVTVSPESPDSTYVIGSAVTIEAVPNTAWNFDQWTGDVSSENPVVEVVMNGPKTVIANFYSRSITLDLSGSGSVVRTPDQTFYELGDTVVLEAVPAEDHVFSHWHDGGTDPVRTITIGKDNSVGATFMDPESDEFERYFYPGRQWLLGGGSSLVSLYSIGALEDGYLVFSKSSQVLVDKQGVVKNPLVPHMSLTEYARFAQTQDGGLLFPGHWQGDAYFAKYSSEGNVEWVRSFEADLDAKTQVVIETADGGFVIAATTKAGIGGDKTVPRPTTEGWNNNFDIWLLRTDAEGTILWQQSYGGDSEDSPHFILETTSGDLLLLATTSSATGTGNKTVDGGVWVLKLDGGNGDILWQQAYGKRTDRPRGMVLNADGGFTVAGGRTDSVSYGSTSEWGYMNPYVWVLRADATGQIIWSKNYGGSGSDRAEALLALEDGGFLVAASSNSLPSTTPPYNKTARHFGSFDYWMFRLDADGEITWQDSFGGSGNDSPISLLRDEDGSILVGGNSSSSVSGTKTEEKIQSTDYWFLRINSTRQKKGQPVLLIKVTHGTVQSFQAKENCTLIWSRPAAAGRFIIRLTGVILW